MSDSEQSREPILVEREKTHGSFTNVAQISQRLKEYFRSTQKGYADGLSNIRQVEALDMIAVKLARILAGNPNEKDHWIDIAGYAKLGAEACTTK